MPSSLPAVTSGFAAPGLAAPGLRAHCFTPNGNAKLGPKTRPKRSLGLLYVPRAHGTTSALASHQVIGQVTDIPLRYRFLLERENGPALKSLHTLSQGECSKQHPHVEFLMARKPEVE